MIPQTQEQPASVLTEEQNEHFARVKAEKDAQIMDRINALSQRLSMEAMKRSGLRQALEERWLEDLQQYNGIYDSATLENIKAMQGSQVFINLTRPRVKTAAARLADMLFPTDDKNWDLSPTPVPELVKMLDSTEPLRDEKGQVLMGENTDAEGNPIPLTEADRAANTMRQARDAAKGMGLEIDDQLTEALYPQKCRRAINDACLYGTGVLKGPILRGRTKRQWKSITGKNGQKVRELSQVEDARPGVEYVDIWNFFPDMGVGVLEESELNMERMFYTKSQLKALANHPGYIAQNIARAVELGPKVSQLTRYSVSEKRDSATVDGTQSSVDSLYEAWEAHGPLEIEDLLALGVEISDEEMAKAPTMNACVVFVGQVVIKVYINPLETGANPYKVFCYEKDETCIFGFGVPYRMRYSQKMLNAAVRALMDNAALSVGPQVIVAKRFVQPADNDWKLRGRKVWEMTDATRSVRDVMATFNIDSHQAELQAIINLAERFADTETNLPVIAQGDQGQTTKTLGGMSLLNNNANVITRDTVKNWDDGITAPLIRDFYDWNMQNSDKEHIKGDYEVDARGSSALLSKEIQAQNLMALGANFAGHPVFGAMTKPLDLYRKIVQAMHIAADDVVVSDNEYKEMLNRQQNSQTPPEVQVEQMRQEFEAQQSDKMHQANLELETMRHEHRMAEFDSEHQDNMIRYASQERIAMADLKALLAGETIKGQQRRIAQAEKVSSEAVLQQGDQRHEKTMKRGDFVANAMLQKDDQNASAEQNEMQREHEKHMPKPKKEGKK